MYHRNNWLYAIMFFTTIFYSLGPYSAALASGVNIAPQIPFVDIRVAGKTVRIERNQNTRHRLTNGFARTSRACPPFCVHPMKAASGVETVGELEVIRFLKGRVQAKSGLLIDARLPSFYKSGTIPGSVNIPFNLFSQAENPYYEKILAVLGAVKKPHIQAGQKVLSKWDFSKALDLVLFCNGPWCDQSPRAIKNLITAGYPPNRIFYYRGGMQNWLALGFNIVRPH